jgi:hypothetical protein
MKESESYGPPELCAWQVAATCICVAKCLKKAFHFFITHYESDRSDQLSYAGGGSGGGVGVSFFCAIPNP